MESPSGPRQVAALAVSVPGLALLIGFVVVLVALQVFRAKRSRRVDEG